MATISSRHDGTRDLLHGLPAWLAHRRPGRPADGSALGRGADAPGERARRPQLARGQRRPLRRDRGRRVDGRAGVRRRQRRARIRRHLGPRRDPRGVERLLRGDHRRPHTELHLAEELAEHGAEEGRRHGDLQSVEHGRQRRDQPDLPQLRQPGSAVDGDHVEAGPVGGLEAEQRADDGREEDREGGEEGCRPRRLARLGHRDDDHEQHADRDDRDAVGDDRELHHHALQARHHEHEGGEQQREAVAPQIPGSRLTDRDGEVAGEVRPSAVHDLGDDLRRGGDGLDPARADAREHGGGEHPPQQDDPDAAQ
ncbi:hypothetical protein FF38_08284, partial [Lucilia cuprina]